MNDPGVEFFQGRPGIGRAKNGRPEIRWLAQMTVRAAVVGAGVMGRWHARELERAGGAVVAVADLDAEMAQRLATAHPAARPFGDLERLLAEARPDVVHVCTPTASHAGIAERALRAGAHVLVEKPIAATVAETEQLIEIAESHGRVLCPVHQYLFQPPVRSAERLVARTGSILALDFTACSAGGVGCTDDELDEIAADILPHSLGVIHRLLAADVDELAWRAAIPRPGELQAIAAAAQGTSVSVRVSMSGRPTCSELRIVGERGTVHVDFFHGFALAESGAVSRGRKVARPFVLGGTMVSAAAANLSRRTLRSEPAYPGLRALIGALYAFVRADGSPPITHAESLAVARARERVLAEVEKGTNPRKRAGRRIVREVH
jgi:predicted dehydrogenase